jgi:hypothetical protein
LKPAFLLVVGVHGLVHLLGFAKAFGLAKLEQLRQPVSRPAGLAWLLAALLLLAGAALLLAASGWWWAPAAAGAVLSQALVLASWGDARFGTIGNAVVLLPAAIAALSQAPWSYRARYQREVEAGLARAPGRAAMVTEADLAGLPEPVQRYLRFTGAVGKPRTWNYRLSFRGDFRERPGSPWMSVVVDQHSFADPPARLFLIEASRLGLPLVAFHRYVGPDATFEVKVASLFTVVDARGPEMNRSETVTLLNDMCLLAPSTLLGPGLRWEEVDPRTVRVRWENAGNQVGAVLVFDDAGALSSFASEDRSMSLDGKTYQRLPWFTPIRGWRDFGGRRLPALAEAAWRLPEGEFTYARFEILRVEYDAAR